MFYDTAIILILNNIRHAFRYRTDADISRSKYLSYNELAELSKAKGYMDSAWDQIYLLHCSGCTEDPVAFFDLRDVIRREYSNPTEDGIEDIKNLLIKAFEVPGETSLKEAVEARKNEYRYNG